MCETSTAILNECMTVAASAPPTRHNLALSFLSNNAKMEREREKIDFVFNEPLH